jgi:uncharacterized iron-regulated protein
MSLFFLIAAFVPTTSPVIFDLSTGSAVDVKTMAAELARRDVVFLGEDHDNTVGHRLQLEIIQSLYKLRPDLVISMEQFERDTQGVLNDFLKGRIDEKTFLKQSRPWKNYKKHYRPIVEFARENKLDVIAANVPRPIASLIAAGKEPSLADRAFCPRVTTAPKDRYRELFVEVMNSHGGTTKPESMELYYKSQCCKDDAMAESITDYLTRHPHRKPLIVHLCGKFHSDYGLGTALRVQTRKPLLQTGVVTMEPTEDCTKVKADEFKSRGHYLLVVPKEANKQKPAKAGRKVK